MQGVKVLFPDKAITRFGQPARREDAIQGVHVWHEQILVAHYPIVTST